MNFDFFKKFSGKKFNVPGESIFSRALESFSLGERTLFRIFAGVFIISALGLLIYINQSFLVSVPDYGGSFTEGVIGSPRFVNPLLAISDADRDVSALVYSGLLRPGTEGTLIPDLAESYSISEDGLVYSFTLKEDLEFHDGKPITTDDVEFTIHRAQDPSLKSPRRGSWEGVVVEKISEREINFILKQPYSPFLETLTLGILPKHIWKDSTTDEFSFNTHNIEAVGSGPYRIVDVKKNKSGTPSEYSLDAFGNYALGKPYISKITLKFFPNEEALYDAYEDGDISSISGISPARAQEINREKVSFNQVTLPRVFGVFFNQNQSKLFTQREVRVALNEALNKRALVEDTLLGFGSVLSGPLPFEVEAVQDATSSEAHLTEARDILERNGWKMSSSTGVYEKKTKTDQFILSFSIATGDAPELRSAVENIKKQWETLGADVNVEIYETGDLNQNIIRPRKYESLFFGEVIGRELDLYPFWHSSQRNDPGLNIAVYVNSTVDKILEETRSITDPAVRDAKYASLKEEIGNDMPVVFTYSPDFLYILPKKIQNVSLTKLTIPSERFLNVSGWYIETNKVWKIFTRKNN